MDSSSNTLKSKKTWIIFGSLVALGGLLLGAYLYDLSQDLPDPSQLERYRPKLGSKVYSADGKVIKEFFEERRTFTPLHEMPEHLITALIATEDRSFHHHWGLNSMRTVKALAIDLIYLEKRQGASTITQQLSRQLYLTLEKKWTRKIKELLTALQIEKTYTKQEIIELYLNHMYLGNGYHGVQMASRGYFGKNVQDLNVHESAMLVGLFQRPEAMSPFSRPEACRSRRNLVLRNMYYTGHLTGKELKEYAEKDLDVLEKSANEYYGTAPYFTEHVRQQLWKKYGRDILTDGLKIHTTLDTRIQYAAEQAVSKQLREVQRQVNERLIKEGEHHKVVSQVMLDSLGLTMTQLLADSAKIHRIMSENRPVQTALICIEPKTGYVRALIGGRDFTESKYNRAIQAKRQPGSAFKPFVYTTVIDNGYPPTYEMINQPVVVKQEDGTEWRPQNYDGSIGGFVTLREALARSLNLPTVRVVQQITKAVNVVDRAHKMGITTELLPYDAIAALGAGEVIPIEITSAYASFANQGVLMEPIFITKVEDKDGNVLEENRPHGREVLTKETAYMMTNMLGSVLDHPRGTGGSARWKYGFSRQAGGKSGTTNDYRDTWFIGFTPQFATGVWVGFDRQDMSFKKGTGSSIALPIWAPFMKTIHDTLFLPQEEFQQPAGVIPAQICTVSKKLPNDECPTIADEIFKLGSEPTSYCDVHSGRERRYTRRRGGRRSH